VKKPFLKTGYCGIVLIAASLLLIAVNPVKGGKLPQGFFNPVVAFEFMKTGAEVNELFGNDISGGNGGFIRSMERGTYLDFFYMLVYTTFLLLFSGVCRRITDKNWYVFSIIIVLCVLRYDFGENIQLLEIMAKLPSGDMTAELGQLNFFTWAKWFGLNAAFISFIPFLRKAGGFGRIISVVSLLSAITGAAAFFNRSFLNEIYVLSITFIFILLIIFSFTFTLNAPDTKRKSAR